MGCWSLYSFIPFEYWAFPVREIRIQGHRQIQRIRFRTGKLLAFLDFFRIHVWRIFWIEVYAPLVKSHRTYSLFPDIIHMGRGFASCARPYPFFDPGIHHAVEGFPCPFAFPHG